MLIHKWPQTPYTAFPLDWQVWAQENTVYSAFSKCISWWAMDLVGKNQILHRPSGIISIHVTHPRLYKCLQVHVIANAQLVRFGEAFSKLSKYKRDSGKWKIPTRNVATYATIPIPQRVRADEELTLPLAWWWNSEPCLNRTLRRNTTGWVCLQDIWTLCQYVINRTRQYKYTQHRAPGGSWSITTAVVKICPNRNEIIILLILMHST